MRSLKQAGFLAVNFFLNHRAIPSMGMKQTGYGHSPNEKFFSH